MFDKKIITALRLSELRNSSSSTRKSSAAERQRGSLPKSIPAMIVAATLAVVSGYGADDSEKAQWTGSWAAAPATVIPPVTYSNQTLRMIAHTSVGGDRVRVRISNTFGTEPLVIGAAHVAIRDTGARIISSTDRKLSFGGKSSFSVPVGALVLSDPVSLEVPALTDLAVSLYLPVLSPQIRRTLSRSAPTTLHQLTETSPALLTCPGRP